MTQSPIVPLAPNARYLAPLFWCVYVCVCVFFALLLLSLLALDGGDDPPRVLDGAELEVPDALPGAGCLMGGKRGDRGQLGIHSFITKRRN